MPPCHRCHCGPLGLPAAVSSGGATKGREEGGGGRRNAARVAHTGKKGIGLDLRDLARFSASQSRHCRNKEGNHGLCSLSLHMLR